MQSLFSGLKIVDISTVLAGPSVGMFFAEMGAEVVKIENPRTHGDVTRNWKLPSEDSNSSVSAYFASINYGKTYKWIDISDPTGRGELDQLLQTADILLSNFKQGDLEKFNLDSQTLVALYPTLIHGRIKGFSSDESRIAYDVVLQAETGYMYMNGTSDSGPVKMPVALIDVLAAHQLKEGLLCAIVNRIRSGNEAEVVVSLEESGLAALSNQASNFLMTGFIPKASGSLHPNIAPYGETFTCADGKQLVLAIGSERQFLELCNVLEFPSLPSESRFVSNQNRVMNRSELYTLLEKRFVTKERSEWMKLLHHNQVPAGAIRAMDEVMENPSAVKMIREEVIDGQPTRRLSSIAFHFE